MQDVEQLGGCGFAQPTHAQETCFPVDTSSGNFWHTFHDLAIPGRGPAIELSRTYNSLLAGADGRFGFGWTDPYAMSLSFGSSSVIVHQGNGSQVTFTLNGSTWSAPPRMTATLVRNGDGTWTFTRDSRDVFQFDAGGRLTAIRDLNGYTTTVTYPTSASRVVTDPAGRTVTFALTGGHVTAVTDSSSPPRSLTYGYDPAGNLTDVIDVGGGHWQFTYDGSHRMLTMRSPRFFGDTTTVPAPVVTNHYDSQGRIDWQSDQLGRVTSFDYSSVPGATKVTDPKGNATLYRYQDGLLVSEERGYGTTKLARWFYRYDENSTGRNVLIDPNGHVTRTFYDPAGNPTTVIDALSRATIFTYNSLRQITSVTEPKQVNGQPVTTTLTYDTAGNLLTKSAPLLDSNGATSAVATTTVHYDDPAHPGDVTGLTDPNNNRTGYGYDGFGNLTSVTAPPTAENPAGNRTTFGYDAVRGWRTSMVSPRGNLPGADFEDYTTTYLHDAYGRVTTVRDPLWNAATPTAHQSVTRYDADGNLESFTDGTGSTTTCIYNPAAERTEVRRADGSVLRSEYWPDGSLRRQLDGASQPTSYEYDPRGSLSSATDPLNRVTTYDHDGAG